MSITAAVGSDGAPHLGGPAAIPTGRRLDRVRFQWSSIPLLLPAAALLIVLFLGPVLYSFYLGFTNLDLIGPTALHYRFTGLDNVRRLIHDVVFHQSLYLTAFFVVGSGVVGATGVGLILAVAMERALGWVRLLIGAIVILCFMLPPITVAMVWYAASTANGTLTTLLGSPQSDFLHSLPMVLVSAANAWSLTGLAMILFAAALRNIPTDIMESAVLENASAVQRFGRITLPLLKPTIVTTVLLMTLLSLANFTVVYVMTGGGPGTSTMILPVYSYQQAFQFNHLAYGALIGDVMVLLATVFSILYVRVSRAKI
jgi:multiple sugar transport system permease protein